MYKLKKEYKGQNVIVYMPDHSVIKLENATEKEFEKALTQKGNEKFIDVDKRFKENTGTEKKEVKKVVKK